MSEKSEDPKAKTGILDLLKSARDMAFIFAVVLYFMAWVYVYYYLHAFGLTVKAVDIDLYNLLIYSCNVFMYIYGHQLFYLILLAVVYIAATYWPQASAYVAKLMPLIIIALFIWTFHAAKNAAITTADQILKNPGLLRKIVLVFKKIEHQKSDVPHKKEPVTTSPDTLLSFNEENKKSIIDQGQSGSFRILTENKEQYYLLQYTPDYKEKFATVYVIQKDLIESAYITK